MDDAGEALKDSQFSATVKRADGLSLVVPEYNHSFPGLLKHVLDTNLKEYIHKAVGVCGVSAGPFGGARMIQSLLPVLRELGLVAIFSDVYFGTARKAFRSSDRQNHRSSLHRSRGEIFRRACLDGARSPLRAREHPIAVILPMLPRSCLGRSRRWQRPACRKFRLSSCSSRRLRCRGFRRCFSCSFLLRLRRGCRVRETLVNRLCFDGMDFMIISVRFGKLLSP